MRAGGLQVMTIHKAKGLEFDYVIVPGLDRVPTSDNAQLMQWLERPAESGPAELLLSPIYPPDADKKDDSIYCWIERLAAAAAGARRRAPAVRRCDARPQTVAMAGLPSERRWRSVLLRARTRCCSDCGRRWKTNAGARFLRALSALRRSLHRFRSLRRMTSRCEDCLPIGHFPIAPPAVRWQRRRAASRRARRSSFRGLARPRAASEWWCIAGCSASAKTALSGWNAERVQAIAPRIERELAAAGISGGELKAARSRVAQALTSALSDTRATLAARTAQRRTQRASIDRSQRKAAAKRIVLDRTFVDDQGARWIIDYKTGTHEGADVEGFLDRERLRYSGQLELYAQALGGAAQLGLYFPLLNGWREWKSKSGEG